MWCTHVLELGIGLGHIRRYINKMIIGVITSLDKMNTRDDTPMDKRNVVIGVVTWQNRFRGGIPRCPSLKLIILGLLNYFQFQFQYLNYYHTTPRGNFVYKLGTILSSNELNVSKITSLLVHTVVLWRLWLLVVLDRRTNQGTDKVTYWAVLDS